MRQIFAILALILASHVYASDCLVSITVDDYVASGQKPDIRYQKQSVFHRFLVSSIEARVRPYEGDMTELLPAIDRYIVKGGYLRFGLKELLPATRILAQSQQEDGDVVVLQRGRSSFSSPLKIFMALSGHPDQVEDVWIVMVRDGTVRWLHRLLSIQSSRVVFDVKVGAEPKAKEKH